MSKSGKITKIYAVVDWLGNPVHFILTGGKVHDSKQAILLLSELNICSSNILTNRAYGAKDIRNYIDSQGAKYTIVPKTNTKEPWDYDYWLYKERHRAAFSRMFFSIKSKLFVELLLVMISLLLLFSLLFILLLYAF